MNWVPEDGKRTRGRPQKDRTYDVLRRSTRQGVKRRVANDRRDEGGIGTGGIKCK